MKNKGLYSITGVVAVLIALVALNVITSIGRQRIDLTQNKAYTLSEGTRNVLAGLKEPVKLRLYVTQDEDTVPLPYRDYARRVAELLDEYRQAGGRNIVIERFNPQPDSDAEDAAGIDGIEAQANSNGDRFYFGLAALRGEARSSIASLALERERLLEYDITRAITRATKSDKPVLGVMTPLMVNGNPMLAMQGQPQVPLYFWSELGRDYTIERISLDATEIKPQINTLIVIHPRGISDQAQQAIDQFVLRGGRLVVFVDPMAYFDQIPGMPPSGGGTTSSLPALFKAWGYEMSESKVVLDLENAAGQGQRQMPTVLALDGPYLNRDDISTSQIGNTLIPMAGAFVGKPAEGLRATVLLKSSKNAQLVDVGTADRRGQEAIRGFASEKTEFPIALKLTGKFKTAFADTAQIKESSAETTVVLVADTDFMNDGAAVQVQEMFGRRIAYPVNGNLPLFQAIVEQMAGDPALIALASRQVSTRPLTLVRQIEAQAQQRYLGKLKELEDSLAEAKAKVASLASSPGTAAPGAPAGAAGAAPGTAAGAAGNTARNVLSAEQQAEVEKFRKKAIDTRAELKEVRKELRADTEALEFWTKVLNIGFMPLLLALLGIALAVRRRRRQSMSTV